MNMNFARTVEPLFRYFYDVFIKSSETGLRKSVTKLKIRARPLLAHERENMR